MSEEPTAIAPVLVDETDCLALQLMETRIALLQSQFENLKLSIGAKLGVKPPFRIDYGTRVIEIQ